jgi:sugar PTS system EIIA component
VTDDLVVRSPLGGQVVGLADLPDPVFAQAMVGPGVAVEPTGPVTDLHAPVDGVVSAVLPHAVVVTAGDRAVLVHLGLDTVGLRGEGFVVHVEPGDVVRAGAVLVTWDTAVAASHGLSLLCPVVGLQADDRLQPLVEPGTSVVPGDPLLLWR